jgi:hypothetical protein
MWAVRGSAGDRRRRVIMVVGIGIVSRIISTVVGRVVIVVGRVVIVVGRVVIVVIIIRIIISPIIISISLIQGVSRMLVEEVHHCLE